MSDTSSDPLARLRVRNEVSNQISLVDEATNFLRQHFGKDETLPSSPDGAEPSIAECGYFLVKRLRNALRDVGTLPAPQPEIEALKAEVVRLNACYDDQSKGFASSVAAYEDLYADVDVMEEALRQIAALPMGAITLSADFMLDKLRETARIALSKTADSLASAPQPQTWQPLAVELAKRVTCYEQSHGVLCVECQREDRGCLRAWAIHNDWPLPAAPREQKEPK